MSDKTKCHKCGVRDARMRWFVRWTNNSTGAWETALCAKCEDVLAEAGRLVTEVCKPLSQIQREAEDQKRADGEIADLRDQLEAARAAIQRGADIEAANPGYPKEHA